MNDDVKEMNGGFSSFTMANMNDESYSTTMIITKTNHTNHTSVARRGESAVEQANMETRNYIKSRKRRSIGST